jgi:hypothetical protein
MNGEDYETTRPQTPGGWRVGDRVWTEWHGTCRICRLRARGRGQPPQALIEPGWLPEHKEWTLLDERWQPLAPDEPDRPSVGLQTVRIGQMVKHWKFGRGWVMELVKSERGQPAARVLFGADVGQRVIILGSGGLLDAPTSGHR